MKEPDRNSTAFTPNELGDKLKDESSETVYSEGTIPSGHYESQTVGFETKEEQESSYSKLLQTPLPSIPRQKIRGKTVAMWSIERRRVVQMLLDTWRKASQNVSEPSFAVYVDQLVDEIDQQIPLFRDIPYEDAFPGILQLARDALRGTNFARIQGEHLENVIDGIFSTLAEEERLSLSAYKRIHELLMQSQLLGKSG